MNWLPTQGSTDSKLAELDGAGNTPLEIWAADTRRQPRESGWSSLSGRWVQIAYVLLDTFFVCFNSLILFSIRFFHAPLAQLSHPNTIYVPHDLPVEAYLGFLLLYVALVVLCCQSQDLYWTPRDRTALDESFVVIKAVILATGLLIIFVYLSGNKEISRLVVGSSGLLNLATFVAWRLWKRQIVIRRVAKGHGARNALIVGAGKVGCALARHLEQNKHLGYVVKGLLDRNHTGDARLLGKVEDLSRVARSEFADVVFITIPSERELVKTVALEARRLRLAVKVVPELYDGLGWRAPLRYVGEFPVMELHREPIPTLGLWIKRLLDFTLSFLGLLLLSPLLVGLAIAIQLDSPGPVFYRSKRAGKKGHIFVCYKFRTMVEDADALKNDLRHLNERNGPFFKISNDPRVTPLGRFLRKFSLDELPQLWNVLRGDLSLVGPRPHPLDDFEQYSLEHFRRLDVKPGLSGLWQVKARRDPSFETNMALDLEYIENWNIWLDLRILLATIPEVMRGNGR